MSKIFAVLLLAAVIAAASAQYVYNSGLAYSGYASPLAYTTGYTGYSGLGYASYPAYTGYGYGSYATPYYGGLAYYKK